MRILPVQWLDTAPSTNTHLRGLLEEEPSLPSGTIVATTQQTAGRGRHQRVWLTTPGKDLAVSVLVRADVPSEWLPSLPMAAALAVAEGLRPYSAETRVKWPNDVRIDEAKVCGILSEFAGEAPSGEKAAIVGFGINVNMTAREAAAIGQPATSLRILCGGPLDPRRVLDSVLDPLAGWLSAWERLGFGGLRDAWCAATDDIGREVRVVEGGECIHGIVTGFGDLGELVIRAGTGETRPVVLGDVVR